MLDAEAVLEAPEDEVACGRFKDVETAKEVGAELLAYAEGILSVARDLEFRGTCGWR